MAGVGHVAVGLLAARMRDRQPPRWRSAASWVAVSLLPDVDFLAFLFGIGYGEPWGHRGVFHCFAFAVLCGIVAALTARLDRRRRARFGTAVAVVVATHPLLDAMTDYGIGCMLLWPFDGTRYFLPWRIVPTIPRFADLYTFEAWKVGGRELLLFSPLMALALWPTRKGRG